MKPIAAMFFTLMLPITSQAQGVYPIKPVKLFVSSAAGSAPDIVARITAQRLNSSWAQPVKSSAQMATELVAGAVRVLLPQCSSRASQVRAGKLRALAATTAKRFPNTQEVRR